MRFQPIFDWFNQKLNRGYTTVFISVVNEFWLIEKYIMFYDIQ